MQDAMTPERSDRTAGDHPAAVDRTAPSEGDSPDDPRYQRIVDYVNAALAIQDPLASNVAAVNSDLLLIGYGLKQAIAAAMDMTPAALDEFEKLMPAIEAFMRITRQVERFAKLEIQLVKTATTPPPDLVMEQGAGDGASEEIRS